MKKIALSLLAAAFTCYSDAIFSATFTTIDSASNWSGFYLGGNAGYWRPSNDKIVTTSSPTFTNTIYELGASNIANALAQIGTNSFSLHPHGFMGGAQAGYNYQTNQGLLFGIGIDFDSLTNSSNTYSLQKTVNLVDFDESYLGSFIVKQKINYLGTVRARLGYLFYPTFLLYATGGFAYGNVTLNTSWTAQESLGAEDFPPIATQNNSSKALSGWTAGAGVEWLFQPQWSAMLEYTYYNFKNLNAPVTLAQINGSLTPPSLWASAATNTALSLSVGALRVGVNYHFG